MAEAGKEGAMGLALPNACAELLAVVRCRTEQARLCELNDYLVLHVRNLTQEADMH